MDSAPEMLLHFRLTEKIGEGGMGAVWRAVDTTLDREVAVKLLPDMFSGDADRLARFDREAKLLASLSHPNIAGIYGIHEAPAAGPGQAPVRFLAMELIEGEDLADRLQRGPLPRDETLRISLQISQALEAAHESGVIHRDLKPANIKLATDGTVKVLDFGLAKAFAPDASADGASASLSPTLTATGTMAGVILGTAAYMSPEQAKGKPVDRRADIWSFGGVIYEMLSGRRLFSGETISETLAAVMMKDVDFDVLPADTPPRLRRLLQRCLQRDPARRLRDIGDARIALEETLADPDGREPDHFTAVRRSTWMSLAPWVVAAAAIVTAVALALFPLAGRDETGVMRFTMDMPGGKDLPGDALPTMAISPDGTRLVVLAEGPTRDLLYQRLIDQDVWTPLPGTEGADTPFFSPDGQWIGFAQDGKLMKMSVFGGPPTTLCAAPRLRGAVWSPDGTITFAPDRASGLMRVSDGGGTPQSLTEVQAIGATVSAPSHRWPESVPEANAILYTATSNNSRYTDADIVALTLDDMQTKTVVQGGTFPRFIPPAFLVFAREETLFGARFDPDRLELIGQPVPVLEDIQYFAFFGNAQLTFSHAGTLIYLQGTALSDDSMLVWLDRDGNETPASSNAGSYENGNLSPDGRHLAVEISDVNSSDIWILEFERDTLTRFTFDTFVDSNPIWSPDGEWIVFSSLRNEVTPNLYRKRANGTGEVERLTTSENPHQPRSWSPDGRIIAFSEVGIETGPDLMLLHLDLEPSVEVFLRTPFAELDAAISPDGRWLAYTSTESGEVEIYVRPLQGPGGQVKISTQGGRRAGWSPDSRQVLFLEGDEATDERRLVAADIEVEGDALRPGRPRRLLDYPEFYRSRWVGGMPDGRILASKRALAEQGEIQLPKVIVNWFDELEQKIPTAR